jgi:signal transduction histidine kinase/ligand-binding sensor domain-containing protein/DNA-binding response OmpR family regulator
LKEHSHFTFVLIFIWGIFFTYSSTEALDPQKAITQYKLDTWQRERGLDHRSVVSICQTSDGYLWLGTFSGLVRFDGIRFKTYNTGNTKQLPDNFIWTILEDHQRNLWIGTKGGLSCYSDGKFKAYPPPEFPDDEILTMTLCRTKGLWIGTLNKGLFHFKNNQTIHYGDKEGLTCKLIRTIHEDEDGTLWVGTPDGLFISRPSNPRKFTKYQGKNGPFSKNSYALLRTTAGELWIGCGDGLYLLKDNGFKHYAINLPNPEIIRLYEDSDYNLWACTDGSGFIRVKENGIETLPSNHRLASDYIYAIFEDREKNLWLGSEGEGLHRLHDTLFTPITTLEGLNHNDVNCIYQDRDGSLLFGTAKGINQFKNGKLTSKWTQKEGLLSNNVLTILKDSKGFTWIGTDKGFNRYKNGKPSPINDRNIYHNNYMLQIEEDLTGAVWILSEKNIGRYYNGKYEDVKNIKGKIQRLFIDRDNTVRGATYKDGFYTLKNGKFIQTTTRDNLVNDGVKSLYKDQEGILYICTRGGLSLLIDGEFFNITDEQGLVDGFVRHIAEDDLGFLWLTDRIGFSRIDKKELLDVARGKKKKVSPLRFNDLHGLKSPYCYDYIKTADGRLWFATDKGVAMIDPAKVKNYRPPPLIRLEELIADGRTYYLGNRKYNKVNPLTIPAGTQRVEFKYTAFGFVNPLKITFKYKLENYDKGWIDRGTIRNTSFNDLSPGHYTFRVKPGDDAGWKSNDKDAVGVSFYLKPYLYETLWFYITAALFVLFAAFSIYRLRVQQLKNRQKELAREVKIRTKEVDEKNRQLELQSEKLKELDHAKSRFFANISHEFRTPLTLLIGPLDQMIKQCNENESGRKRRLILMLRNAQRLLRLINQLLELSKLDSGKMKLQKVNTDIVSFIHGIAESFLFLAQQKELALVFHTGHEPGNGEIFAEIDPRKMEDIMSNLLINAIKFTPPGGEILVTITPEPLKNESFPRGFFRVSVTDTGPGIPEDQLPYVFDRFYQADATYENHAKGSGIGLALCKELVELHGGTITAGNRENGGGEFVLRLPRCAPIDDKGGNTNHEKNLFDTGPYAVMVEDEISGLPSSSSPVHTAQGTEEKEEKDIVLVVEDSADMREYVKVSLEPQYQVEEAKDGEEGVDKARAIIPDLIVSDIMMPGKDGNELCRALKSDVNTCHIPIILLTARASEENIIEGLQTGADDYITKPFSTAILNARIKNLIDLRSQLQQNFKRELNLRPVKTSLSTLDEEFLGELQTALKENLSDPDFNVEEMCKHLYMGNTTLYRKVRALCGITPTEFIRSYRLKRAAQLLKSGFGSVTEVAFEVGFSSRAYFTKCFKEKFNRLPSEVENEG